MDEKLNRSHRRNLRIKETIQASKAKLFVCRGLSYVPWIKWNKAIVIKQNASSMYENTPGWGLECIHVHVFYVMLLTFSFPFSDIPIILLFSTGRSMQSLLKYTVLSPVSRIYRAAIFDQKILTVH